MLKVITDIDGVWVNNLYENYPDFYIDIAKEQQLLQLHDIIVWHHPFYWYSAPALLKEWFDLVLQHGFAYGTTGRQLEGKKALSVISTGGQKEVYSETGKNQYTINQFLAPFKQSANLCRMEYLPPFVIHGSHTIKQTEIDKIADQYKKILISLRDEKIDYAAIHKLEYFNEITL
ncbi:MAG: NAD(P)H-dependent oxidoreductase, partial [Prolixibacteraceae bacterium]|nr:NAD(P)H-dependent oxidoreductase [Prolixibacteraceae bacterium]